MLRFGRYALPLVAIVLLNILVGECEMSIYPGLRRRPQLQAQLIQQQQQQPMDVSIDFLNQLMEENARRRLQQQFDHQLQLINLQIARQHRRQERLREHLRQQQIQLQKQQLQQEQQQQQQRQQEQQQEFDDENNDNDNDENIDYNTNKKYNSNKYNNNYNNYKNNNNNNNNNNVYEQYDNINERDFSYKYPKFPLEDSEKLLRQRIQFAVSPLDPRYYAEETPNINDVSSADDDDELDSKALDEYEEYVPAESSKPAGTVVVETNGRIDKQQSSIGSIEPTKDAADSILAPAPVLPPAHIDVAATTFHRIKPQTAAAAVVAGVNIKQPIQHQHQHQQQQQQSLPSTNINNDNNNLRHDYISLIDKMQKEGKSGAILSGAHDASALIGQDAEQQQMVVRQHLGMMDNDMGMYIVALIAGVSAATTVGLIALGIAWVHNKAKAAADVEYPAYGITGPNKDISPSGDRKLAQSAQMYHYQHQKQQIIAMENRQAAEGSCGLSDVESDDDNEEGDYTVYECPGLAPTGEMEVKNPLFLDETPITPSTGNINNVNSNNVNAATNVSSITQTTAQQPPQQQLGKKTVAKGATDSSMIKSSDGKNNKTKKQDKK